MNISTHQPNQSDLAVPGVPAATL